MITHHDIDDQWSVIIVFVLSWLPLNLFNVFVDLELDMAIFGYDWWYVDILTSLSYDCEDDDVFVNMVIFGKDWRYDNILSFDDNIITWWCTIIRNTKMVMYLSTCIWIVDMIMVIMMIMAMGRVTTWYHDNHPCYPRADFSRTSAGLTVRVTLQKKLLNIIIAQERIEQKTGKTTKLIDLLWGRPTSVNPS